jgi:hypothetical protein
LELSFFSGTQKYRIHFLFYAKKLAVNAQKNVTNMLMTIAKPAQRLVIDVLKYAMNIMKVLRINNM